jgi:EAL domain-containing protein (putative c-di-GMP-specific phosphodiesterase class I)/FixJ family two-component response regulator
MPMNAEAARWKVLLVDDEPAVHQVSQLILADVQFDGRGIELSCAQSAAQAREMLARERDVALVLLDVVMETDDAGLALVQHIREQRRDHLVQIVLRTGQPGAAPEREVVLRHEINGYWLKTDLTAQRLRSIVISALRTYRLARNGPAASGSTPARADTSAEALRIELARAAPGDAVVWQAQPEIALASNRVAGIELVPMWKTSIGLLPAARVFETLVDAATRRAHALHLLAHACAWARTWRTNDTALTVSIPAVGDCIDDGQTQARVGEMVQQAALPRGTLDLLVGETSLLRGGSVLQQARAQLRAAGVGFTLVDVGAGTISLQRLAQLGPDRLKIHRPFVRNVSADPERMALARSVIALAHTLRIVAIADGIACDSDAQFFRWEGCELGQGDALVPACAPGDVAKLLQ